MKKSGTFFSLGKTLRDVQRARVAQEREPSRSSSWLHGDLGASAFHSARSATIGSTLSALRDGIHVAIIATTINSVETPAIVSGSVAVTPNRNCATSLDAMNAPTRPIATPLSARIRPATQHRPDDLARRCAERDADADLARLLRDAEADQPVQPDRGEHERDDCE